MTAGNDSKALTDPNGKLFKEAEESIQKPMTTLIPGCKVKLDRYLFNCKCPFKF